jgi:aminoglycoside phosphotransferase (APT) family kinase protein
MAAADLIPVQPHHRFDEARLAAHLAEHLPEFKTPLTVQQFKGPAASPAFMLHSPGRNFVLRKRSQPRKGCSMAESIERDFSLLRALHAAGLPVGQPQFACTDEGVIGAPFYVLDYVPGRHFRDPNLPGMDAKQRHAHYEAMAETLARLHGLTPSQTGLPANGSGLDYMTRQVAALTEQYRANVTDEIAPMERLLDWLPSHLPADDVTSLMHGNFRLESLVFHPSEPRVVAVHDWDLALIGHPLADLAINCMPWRVTIPGMGSLQGIDFIETGIPGEPDYLGAYCRHAARDDIPHWNFYLAFALFRVAVMAQGIVKRGSNGAPASPAAAQALKAYGALVRSVANQAWNLIDNSD